MDYKERTELILTDIEEVMLLAKNNYGNFETAKELRYNFITALEEKLNDWIDTHNDEINKLVKEELEEG